MQFTSNGISIVACGSKHEYYLIRYQLNSYIAPRINKKYATRIHMNLTKGFYSLSPKGVQT